MKKSYPTLLLAGSALLGLLWMLPLGAQSASSDDALLPLIQSVVEQQKQIDENQANIDKSLATIQENLRQAKIYIGRAGGSPKK